MKSSPSKTQETLNRTESLACIPRQNDAIDWLEMDNGDIVFTYACSSYLQRQLSAASPEFICTMGMVATRTLLRQSQPLSKLRGRFHTYKAADGVEIPLLPTYHPGYLLQNPEMKTATWQDLQLLQKRL